MDIRIPAIPTPRGVLTEATIEEARAAGAGEAAIAAALDVALVLAAERRIDRAGDRLSVSSSRAARYIQKAAEARAYVAAGRPASVGQADYPILVLEASARGLTKGALADLILAREAAFVGLMGAAEAARASLTPAIAGAADEGAKRAAADALVAPFEAAVAAALTA